MLAQTVAVVAYAEFDNVEIDHDRNAVFDSAV